MVRASKNLSNAQNLTRLAEKCGSEIPALVSDQLRTTAMTSDYMGGVGAGALLSRHLFDGDGFGVVRQVIHEGQQVSVSVCRLHKWTTDIHRCYLERY